jgi:hypothetical protein
MNFKKRTAQEGYFSFQQISKGTRVNRAKVDVKVRRSK